MFNQSGGTPNEATEEMSGVSNPLFRTPEMMITMEIFVGALHFPNKIFKLL